MGMSTYVYGLKEHTKEYIAMKMVRKNCEYLKIQEPREVEIFFDKVYGSDDDGERVDLPPEVVYEYNAEMQNGYQVDIEKLREISPDVKIIRFVNSY